MKFNLKNCPCKYEQDYEPCKECEQWKKGFEKELREEKVRVEKELEIMPYDEGVNLALSIIKEILGE